jgi:hypothetical protein
VQVKVYSGSSVLSPGSPTDRVETIDRVLSPLAEEEIGGSIRCIGLNVSFLVYAISDRYGLYVADRVSQYRQHAEEMSLSLPEVPTIFMYVFHQSSSNRPPTPEEKEE